MGCSPYGAQRGSACGAFVFGTPCSCSSFLVELFRFYFRCARFSCVVASSAPGTWRARATPLYDVVVVHDPASYAIAHSGECPGYNDLKLAEAFEKDVKVGYGMLCTSRCLRRWSSVLPSCQLLELRSGSCRGIVDVSMCIIICLFCARFWPRS